MSTLSEMEQDQQHSQGINLPIDWHISESIQSRYATNMVVQAGQNEFIISFFEAQIPLFVGQADENRSKLEQLDAIRAECVGRIIVAAEQMPGIIAALQTSLEAYHASKAQK